METRTAGLAGGLALVAAPAFAAQPEDAWITTKVKMALLTDDTVDGLDINVDTFDGRVTLHGTVDSAVEKAEARASPGRSRASRDIRNLLAVVPAIGQKADRGGATKRSTST